MKVTCNRAFDGTPDIFQALEDIIECGCERVLTSGGKISASDGSSILKQLVSQANGRISIMPGAGVKSENIYSLIQKTGATEFHASARVIMPNTLEYINSQISDYGNVYVSSEHELTKMITLLKDA